MTFCFSLHSKSLSRIHIENKPKIGTVKIRDTETEGGEQLTHIHSHRRMAISPLNTSSMYVKLKDRKRSLSRKNNHNALWR